MKSILRKILPKPCPFAFRSMYRIFYDAFILDGREEARKDIKNNPDWVKERSWMFIPRFENKMNGWSKEITKFMKERHEA